MTQLSIAQQKHAAAISTAPHRNAASARPRQDHTGHQRPAPCRYRPGVRCARGTPPRRRSVVNTSSRFNNSDAVAPDTDPSPAASSTGPIAPPTTTAMASRGAARRTVTLDGRARPSTGTTAIAAPRYRSPARRERADVVGGQLRGQRRRDPEQHGCDRAPQHGPRAHCRRPRWERVNRTRQVCPLPDAAGPWTSSGRRGCQPVAVDGQPRRVVDQMRPRPVWPRARRSRVSSRSRT